MSSSTTYTINPQDFSAAQRGDRNAYSRLVAAAQRMVTSVALAQVRDLQLSEDIAQETFLQAWQRIAQMRSAGSFLPWLREVARNRAIDYLRTMRYRESAAADLPELADQVHAAGSLFASIALVLGAVAIEMAIYFKRAKTPASRRALLRHGVVYGALMGSYILLLWHAARNNWALWQTLACGVLVSVAIVMLAIERGRIVAAGRNGAE